MSGGRTTTVSPTRIPGFVDHVVNKKADVIRVYFPPDTNTLLSTAEHCLASVNYVNVIVAGKQPCFDWLTPDEAGNHCARGLGIWDWASTPTQPHVDPDVVIACAGDVPTLEALAATAILRQHLPELKIRFVNVVDLMRLQAEIGASARAVGPRLRHPVHRRQAGHLRLPRLSVADPSADLPADQPRQHPRPRVQGGGHDLDARSTW